MMKLAWLSAQVLYLYAPLLLSAAISGLVMRLDALRALRKPIDGGRSYHGRRIFGDSKTWRGVVLAVAGCVLGAAIQKHLIGPRAGRLALVDYANVNVWLFGLAMGGGAMLGELPNSFVKRRLDIAPGATATGSQRVLFYVWDQIDLLTTSWPLLACWVRPSLTLVSVSVLVTLTLHPLSSLIGYIIGARRTAR